MDEVHRPTAEQRRALPADLERRRAQLQAVDRSQLTPEELADLREHAHSMFIEDLFLEDD